MNNRLLLGLSRWMLPIPRMVWQRQIAANARNMAARLDFMSADHHRVRNFVVTEIVRVGQALSPEHIGQALNMPVDRVMAILDDLEKHMTFLFRNEQGAVAWAYPVTADQTPHRLRLNTGEHVYAA